jgi:nucleotidyltransferase/DNA polymerase involved in DNA repair
MIACLRIPGLAAYMQHAPAFDELMETLTGFTRQLEVVDERQTEDGHSSPSSDVCGRPSIIYLGLNGLHWIAAVSTTQQIGQAVRERVGLALSIGLARSRFTAYVAAATVKPNEALFIPPGEEADFLAPLPVGLLPLDDELARRLRLLGIRTLGQLAALPAGAVLTQFGREGQRLQRLAGGRDDCPVLPRRPTMGERVTHRFDGSVADRIILRTVARAAAEELARRLQARGQAARELSLTLYLEDGTAHEEAIVLRQPTADASHIIYALDQLLARARVSCGVEELEVTLSGLVPASGRQLNLFVHGAVQERRLRGVLRNLVTRYGADCFYRVSLTDQEARLPERRFRLQEMDMP